MMQHLKGSGIGNVYLLNGYTISGEGDERATAYEDLDGLYRELALAIARRNTIMTGRELRFLRKRLGMSQAGVGALGSKTDQVVAKWEKGDLPVPTAEARLLRLLALQQLGRRGAMTSAMVTLTQDPAPAESAYFFEHTATGWQENRARALQSSRAQSEQLTTELLDGVKRIAEFQVAIQPEVSTVRERPIQISN